MANNSKNGVGGGVPPIRSGAPSRPPGFGTVNPPSRPQQPAGGSNQGGSAEGQNKLPLHLAYPLNSTMELKLNTDEEVVAGVVYCTDEVSNTVVLMKPLVHTTLSADFRIVNADTVASRRTVSDAVNSADTAAAPRKTPTSTASSDEVAAASAQKPVPLPTNVTRKAMEDKERRAMKLAEEGLSHINQKATPMGLAVFDRLVKACNEVVWHGESIYVLNQVRVDPPYGATDCRLLPPSDGGTASSSSSLSNDSLERVKKIVSTVVLRPNT